MTAGSDGRTNPSPDPSNNLLGRRPRGISSQGGASAPMTARAYGMASNPDLGINSDARGEAAAYPGHGTGGFLSGSNSFFGLRFPRRQRPGAWYDPGGPSGAYGGGWADGKLTVRDRHIMVRYGTEKHSGYEANNGIPNPLHDSPGHGQPQYQMVNTSEAWQIGTDDTRGMDNTGQHNTVPVAHNQAAFNLLQSDWTGRQVYPLGQQDGSQTLVFGPPPGEWREYGVRGPSGMHGPAPDIIDPNIKGSAYVVVQAGAPGMQAADRRTVWGGVPHGLHSPTVQSTKFTSSRFANTIQMVPPRVDRPASSKQAGQSYSQTIVPQALAGQANQQPRLQDPGRQAGLRARFAGRT
jgi:hypothetical protein